MSSGSQLFTQPASNAAHFSTEARWYAIHTRSRHEKRVDVSLQQSGVASFLPLLKQVHHWSDRRQTVDVPLFPCYMFVHMDAASPVRRQVLKTPGVLGLVGGQAGAIPIPSWEIEQVQRVLAERLLLAPHPFLKLGQRVRVRGGALDGLEGILTSNQSTTTVVISVELIQRSISVSIEGYDLEPA